MLSRKIKQEIDLKNIGGGDEMRDLSKQHNRHYVV